MRFVQAAKLQDVIDHLLGLGNMDLLRVLDYSLESISQSGYDLDVSFCDFLLVVFQAFFWVLVSFFLLGRIYLSLQNLGRLRMRDMKSYMHPMEGTSSSRNPDMMA